MCTHLEVLMTLLFILGATSTGRNQIAYIMVSEFTPENYRIFVGTYFSVVCALPYIYATIYFEFISKYWLYLVLFTAGLSLLSLINVTLFVPESPKYYFALKQFDDARRIFNYIARFNGATPI
mmetsp:Transcript_7786/g.7246  ORF Transcript_7786/g.7246 Transcript_7786/m.7246 type:complete len:123 (-) Transcript_7786:528-896(-)